MAIRRASSASPPPAKRIKHDNDPSADSKAAKRVPTEAQGIRDVSSLSSVNYRDGVMLAPMVRSGTLPTRLLALKYGANLVWTPEIVDKAIIGCDRVVDHKTGVVTYEKAGRPIWSTHPVERPFLIYQIGSASPDLAVQAALTVVKDVSGVDLNCGCPRPFSTHSGMGANLLTNPDLLCEILVSLRKALPPHIPVTAKIRLLPDQHDTLELVKRIIGTGISALTVHCRTKEMRKQEAALVHRLKDIVECVDDMGLGVPVIENGDCVSRDDAVTVRETTGAHSVMIASAAEKNPSCFRSGPLLDAETELAPAYLALAKYTNNPWGNTKYCLTQFASPRPVNGKLGQKAFKQMLSQAKDYDAFAEMFDVNRGEKIMAEVKDVVERRLLTAQPTGMDSRASVAMNAVINQLELVGSAVNSTLPLDALPDAAVTAPPSSQVITV